MSRKRIVFILLGSYPYFSKNPAFPPSGGAEADMYYIARSLDTNFFDIHFIVGDYGQPRIERLENITFHKVKKNSFFQLFRIIYPLRPDILFSKGISWQTIYLMIIRLILPVKLFIKSSHKRNIDGTLTHTFYGKFCTYFINIIDGFILQNNEDASFFNKTYSRFRGKLICIRNFQDVPAENLHEPFQKKLLWIGRAELFKQPDLFLEIAKKLPSWNCMIVMPHSKNPLFTKIKELSGKIQNVQFIGGLERTALQKELRDSAFLVSTSINEGFPNVIIEALKNGTPIFSLNDYDSIFSQNGGGIILNSAQSIVTELKNVNAKEWQDLSNKAHNIALNLFSSEKNSIHFQELFLGQK